MIDEYLNWCDATNSEKEAYCDKYTDCSQCPYFDRDIENCGGDNNAKKNDKPITTSQ